MSAAYKGIYALQVGSGAKDWVKDVRFDSAHYSSLAVDIHHVFPYRWCNENGIEKSRRDSVVNKTPLAAETNRSVGGRAPKQYLVRIENKANISSSELDELVRTHGINPESLRADDFDKHFAHRKGVIIELIEGAMGKPVQRDAGEVDPLTIAEQYDQSVDSETEQLDLLD